MPNSAIGSRGCEGRCVLCPAENVWAVDAGYNGFVHDRMRTRQISWAEVDMALELIVDME